MTILAAFSFVHHDSASIELGATLARSAGQPLRVVTIVPAPWGTPAAEGTDKEFKDWADRAGQEAVTRARELIAEHCTGVDSEVVAIHARSVPGGLLEEAQRCEASMIVVGSGHDGPYGRIALSSVADRLLHSSPVAVAIAPRGYLATEHGRVTRATCAFRGDEVSGRTLIQTAAICQIVGAGLRIATFAVRGRTMYTSGVSPRSEDDVVSVWVQRARAMQSEALAELRDSGEVPEDVDATVAVGQTWAATLDRLPWDRDEVLVVGSSASASFLSRIFLGSSGAKIIRHAPVPVIVVP